MIFDSYFGYMNGNLNVRINMEISQLYIEIGVL